MELNTAEKSGLGQPWRLTDRDLVNHDRKERSARWRAWAFALFIVGGSGLATAAAAGITERLYQPAAVYVIGDCF